MIPVEIILRNSFKYTKMYNMDIKKDPFPWFLLSIFLAARISEKIAKRTFELFIKYDLLTPEKIVDAGWDSIVEILDEGGYTRYDFKTATKIINISKAIIKRGGFKKILSESKNNDELIKNIKELGSGIGPVTLGIFLRELVGRYDFNPLPDERVKIASKNIGIEPLEYSRMNNIDYGYVENFLSYVGKNCLKNRCEICVAKAYCNYYLSKNKVH